MSDESPEPAPQHDHRRRWIVLGVVGVLVVVGGAVFAKLWSERGAEEASVTDAVDEFREGDGTSVTTADTTPDILRPPAGVYTYTGSGTEHLSLLATEQHWGPNLPATVTHGEGDCWTFRIEYSTNHWQEITYCPSATMLVEEGGSTFQSFDFVASTVDDLNEFTCDPPNQIIRFDAAEGDTWDQSCAGHSTSRGTDVTSAGPTTFLGIETLAIGDEEVEAYHYLQERTMSGSQTGSEHVDVWFAVSNGLPLQLEKDVAVESPSPIGAVTYTEQGTYTLSSLEPQT